MKKITPGIKSKLKKILALAETGLDGEKLLAKEKLTQLLEDYDLTLEDLRQEKKIERIIFKGITTKKLFMLFTQICFKVKNVNSIKYGKIRKNEYIIECTEAEKQVIKSLFEWHKKNMQEELEKMFDDFFVAYCEKHNLFSEQQDEEDSEDVKSIDFERIMRIMSLKENMSDKTYCKRIENLNK